MNQLNHTGYICFFVNAHLPYIAPNLDNERLTYNWLCTSILDSYLPFLNMLDNLIADNVSFRLGFAISPVLLEMFASPRTKEYFEEYLQQRLKLSLHELERLQNNKELLKLATHYHEQVQHLAKLYRVTYNEDIIGHVRQLGQTGHVELIAASASGAFLPLLDPNRELMQGQIELGCQSFEQYFGHKPQGFWTMSAGYRPELDEILLQNGLHYTFLRSIGVLGATPRPAFATYSPIVTPAGVTIFGTDIESTLDIFQSRTGYAYSPEYLDTTIEDQESLDTILTQYLAGESIRYQPHYTARMRRREQHTPYNFEYALESAKHQAQRFVEGRRRQVAWIAGQMGQAPVITIRLRAEMFGQGWYESLPWFENVLRTISANEAPLVTETPQQLTQLRTFQTCTPNTGSGSRGSFNINWLNKSNAWIHKHLSLAGKRLLKMTKIGDQGDELKRRLLNQATRELIVAQCSDWSTMIASGIESKWARRTVRRHLISFHRLFDDFSEGHIDEEELSKLEERTPVFPDIDYHTYCQERVTNVSATQPTPEVAPIKIDKKEVIASIVQIQQVTGELAQLCQQALAKEGDVSQIDLTNKACESVAIVESLAERANDPNALQKYLNTTTKLENIIKVITDVEDSKELLDLHREAIEIVDDWAQTVEDLLKSIIAQAK